MYVAYMYLGFGLRIYSFYFLYIISFFLSFLSISIFHWFDQMCRHFVLLCLLSVAMGPMLATCMCICISIYSGFAMQTLTGLHPKDNKESEHYWPLCRTLYQTDQMALTFSFTSLFRSKKLGLTKALNYWKSWSSHNFSRVLGMCLVLLNKNTKCLFFCFKKMF